MIRKRKGEDHAVVAVSVGGGGQMPTFVAVPSQTLEDHLQKKGYRRTVQRNEVVYIKRSQVDPSLMIKVYTSIAIGQTAVRAAGRDAIRCCVVWDNGFRSFGVGKFPPVFRVHSVQSVLERLDARLKEAVQRAKDWLSEQGAKEDARQKAAFAQREREQEEAAFMSDPGMRDDSPAAFAAYAATLEVPF
jgi:hypothetical protein